eukprot:7317889-Ditylum_brightwellii.AAC.1
MKSADAMLAEYVASAEASRIVAENMAKVLDAKYCKMNLWTDVVDQCNTLKTDNQEELPHVLQKHEELFE